MEEIPESRRQLIIMNLNRPSVIKRAPKRNAESLPTELETNQEPKQTAVDSNTEIERKHRHRGRPRKPKSEKVKKKRGPPRRLTDQERAFNIRESNRRSQQKRRERLKALQRMSPPWKRDSSRSAAQHLPQLGTNCIDDVFSTRSNKNDDCKP